VSRRRIGRAGGFLRGVTIRDHSTRDSFSRASSRLLWRCTRSRKGRGGRARLTLRPHQPSNRTHSVSVGNFPLGPKHRHCALIPSLDGNGQYRVNCD
jgi:hypothetical protein